jgi:hypothetical protein
MDNKKPILGTTLYSFTNEWVQRLYTFDQLVEKVAGLGLGPAIEVVGFQSFREYPDVSDEFAKHFRGLFEHFGLMPSCLGANVDVGRRKGALMTTQEMLDYVQRQLVTARKLGFPVMRIQTFIGPEGFEKIAPLAEKARVHVACELHSPLTNTNPEVIALKAAFDRIGSEYIGFVPDFSSVMTAPPEVYWASLRAMGAPEGLIEAAKQIWNSSRPNPEKYAALAEANARFQGGPAVGNQLNMSMTMFGHMRVKDLAALLPYTRHMHGKFYGVDASGTDPSISYAEIMALFKQEGYTGTISAEWEGHAFTQESIGFQQVQAWHAMCGRLLA